MDSSLSIRRGEAADTDAVLALGVRRISALVDGHHAWAVGFWGALRSIGYERDPAMVRST